MYDGLAFGFISNRTGAFIQNPTQKKQNRKLRVDVFLRKKTDQINSGKTGINFSITFHSCVNHTCEFIATIVKNLNIKLWLCHDDLYCKTVVFASSNLQVIHDETDLI